MDKEAKRKEVIREYRRETPSALALGSSQKTVRYILAEEFFQKRHINII